MRTTTLTAERTIRHNGVRQVVGRTTWREHPLADIRHRVGIAAPQDRVFAAIATRDGLAEWWTRTVDGNPERGGRMRFYFGRPDPGAVMEIVDVHAPDFVVWRCVDGVAEWVGTTLTFNLRTDGNETVVLFTHADWREPVEFMHHCSTKWAYFLLGLKRGLEGGSATPYPDDAPISGWG
jgi:uncharacterized protein YndB with AHSA1/START domain